MARSWGFWTRYKLELLQRYLDAFTTTTKKLSTKRVLPAHLGGEPENVDRDTLLPIDGSARIALNTDNPPFTHLRFFELEPNATKLRQALSREFPGRDWLVYSGDSNDTIHQALADLRAADAGWAPTFAFIDPNGPHYTWNTLQVLAAHKGPKAILRWIASSVPVPIAPNASGSTSTSRQTSPEPTTFRPARTATE
jgi:three-Cys-motif partner protein